MSKKQETIKESLIVGNVAVLRDALKETQSVIAKCMDILNSIPGGVEYDGLIDDVADELCDLRESYIETALAEQKCEAEWELGAEYEYAYCSHCGHQQWADWDSRHEASENIGEFHKKYKFCPNCGFEMKLENDEQ